MTTEILEACPPYTITGTGPYAITHPYQSAGELIVTVEEVREGGATAEIALVLDEDFTVDPVEAQDDAQGNLTLTPAIAATYGGERLIVERATIAEQGWEGVTGPREKGLERQMDRTVQALQDLSARLGRAVCIPVGEGILPRIVPGDPGDVLMFGAADEGIVPGPNIEDIAGAALAAEAANDAASAAMTDRVLAAASADEAATLLAMAEEAAAAAETAAAVVTVHGMRATPEMFGAVGDALDGALGLDPSNEDAPPVWPAGFDQFTETTNDTDAIQAWLAHLAATGREGWLPAGKVYMIDKLDVPAGVRIAGSGKFRWSGADVSAGGRENIVIVGPDCLLEHLHWHQWEGLSGCNGVALHAGCRVGFIHTTAGNPIGGGCINAIGSDVHIGFHRSSTWPRPLVFNGDLVGDGSGWSSNVHLGGAYYLDIARGLRLVNITDSFIGTTFQDRRSLFAYDESPGYNNILVSGAKRVTIDDQMLGEAGEHGIRLAGAAIEDVHFGWITAWKTSASPFKTNADSGVKIRNVTVKGLTIVDPFYSTGANAKSSHVIRLSHCEGVDIGPVRVAFRDLVPPANEGVLLAISDCRHVKIGPLSGDTETFCHVLIDDNIDYNGASGPETVFDTYDIEIRGLEINQARSDVPAIRFNGPQGTSAYDIRFPDLYIRQLASPLVGQTGTPMPITGKGVFLQGRTDETGANRITYDTSSGGSASDPVLIDLVNAADPRGRFIGSLAHYSLMDSFMIRSPGAFDPGNALTAGLMLCNEANAAAAGDNGAGLTLCKPGSGRPGAAIYSYQSGADADEVGLRIAVHLSSSASDVLVQAMQIAHSRDVLFERYVEARRLTLSDMILAADDTAAATAGVPVGGLYRNASGSVRIRVS